MKKYLSIFTVLALALVLNATTASAVVGVDVNATTSAGVTLTPEQKRAQMQADLELKSGIKSEIRDEMKDEMKDEVRDIKAEAKVKIEALQAKVKLLKDAKVKAKEENRWNSRMKALNGFENVMMNVEKTEAKVNMQIEKAGTLITGINLTEAKAFSATAHTKILAAKADVAASYTLVAGVTAGTDLTEAQKKTLKENAEKIQMSIKDARAALNDAMKSLRTELQKAKVAASASTNVNATTTTNN